MLLHPANPPSLASTPGSGRRLLRACVVAAATSLMAASVLAGNINKANNTDDLNLGSSWVGGVVPGTNDVAVWDNTVSGANSTLLGGDLNWSGLQILNPGGAVTIGATSTNANAGAALTLGAGGIDMSSASQNLTLNTPVTLQADSVQSWNVANGKSVQVNGSFSRSAAAQLRFNLTGGATVNIASGTTNSGLIYSILNGTDVGALDGSLNVTGASSVLPYYANTAGGDVFTSSGESAGTYLDMVNGSSSGGDDVDIAQADYISVVRFNTPQPYRNYWIYNVGSEANETADPGSTYLMTANLGAQDVYIEGEGNTFRFNHSGNELILDQEDPDGTFYVNGTGISQRSGAGVITKFGVGRVVWNTPLSGFTGPINIESGEMMINQPTTSSTAVTVGSGGTFSGATTIPDSVTVNGGTIHPGSTNGLGGITVGDLTVNPGSTLQFYSPSTPMNNSSALLDVTGSLALNGPINVSVVAGAPAVGQFPLVHSSSAIDAATFANLSLSIIAPRPVGGYLTNDTANQSIDLVVTNVEEPITWAVGNGTWDTTTANWLDTKGASTTYNQTNESGFLLSDAVLFNDTASGASPITVTLNSDISPGGTTVNNASKDYVFAGSGAITSGALTKTGAGTLTLQTDNSFGGGLNLNGGTVSFSSLANIGSGSISFGGGTLQYASGNTADISGRTVTFNAGGATIDDGGNTLTYTNGVGNGGVGGLTKTGTGTLTLDGTNNNYSGNTVVAQGTLALGASNYLAESAAIIVDSGATLDAGTSGVGLDLSGAANQVLAGSGTVEGVVTNGAGTTITPGTNGVYGTLTISGNLSVDGGTLVFDVSNTNHDLISVGGDLSLDAGSLLVITNSTPLANGTYKLIQYSGSLASGTGSAGNVLLTGFNQPGSTAVLDDSTPGEIDLVVSTAASDHVTWSSTASSWDLSGTLDWLLNGTTPWAFTNGDNVTFDDSGASTVNLQTSLRPGSVTVNNSSQAYTFADGTGSGGGKLAGNTGITKSGTGTLVIETANTYLGPTVINAGTVQVGNGGIGDLGSGKVTDNGALVFAQGDGAVHKVQGEISGTGSVTQSGSSTTALAQNNTYSGPTTISGGTLQVGNGGTAGSLGTDMNVSNDGTLAVNRSDSVSFGYNVSGSGSLVNLGSGTLSLTGNLTYQGGTSISNGVVKINANDQLPNANTVSGSSGSLVLDGGATAAGTLDLNGFNQTINNLSGAYGTVLGTIDNTGGTGTNILTIDNSAGAAMTYNGSINNNAGSGGVLALHILGVGSGQIITIGAAENEPSLNNYSGGTLISNAFVSVGDDYTADQNSFGTGPITLAGTDHTTLAMARSVLGSGAQTGPFQQDIVLAPNSEAQIVTGARPYGFTTGTVSGPASSEMIWNNHYVRTTISGDWTGFYGKIEAGSFTYGNLAGDFRLGGGDNGFNGFPNARVELMAAGSMMGSYTVYSNEVSADMYSANGGQTYYFGELSAQPQTTIDMGDSTIIVGSLNTDAKIAGEFLSGSLVKDGTGTLTLVGGFTTNIVDTTGFGDYVTNIFATNLLSYTGSTTVSNGVLAVTVPDALTSSSSVTLASATAVLDASSMGYASNSIVSGTTNQVLVTNGVFDLVSGQTLAGMGTLRGSLKADSGSTFNVGLPLGSFMVTSNAELAGAVTMSINPGATPDNASELMANSIKVDANATLTVTNLGAEAGGTFQLFNHAVDFASVTLPPTTGTNKWVNNLSTDGSITLLAPQPVTVNTNPAPITVTQGPGTLTLSWPADREGWTLQSQTNAPGTGLGTNWVDVVGSTTTTQESFTISPTNGSVFFRMVYP